MSDHLTDEHILAYRGRKLAPADLLSASNHLAACATCRTRVATPQELRAGLQAIRAGLEAEPGTSHLTYDEIAAYVDGQLLTEDEARVDLHVRDCAPCAADLEGIQALKADLEPPAELETANAPRATEIERPRNRFADFWQTALNGRGFLVLAGAGACALLLVSLAQKPGQPDPHHRAQAEPAKTSAPAVSPEPGKPVETATIRDGNHLVTIAAGGIVSGLDALPDADRAALERVLTAKRVDTPSAIAGLAGARGVLLGPEAEAPRAVLLAPLGVVVETDRPMLRWKPVPGADYLVSVYDSRYDEMASSGWIKDAEWQPSQALRRGEVYSWQLNVRQNGAEFTVPAPPAPEARFQVLSTAEEAGLIRVRGVAGDSHLVLGLQYARAGLLDEAGKELRALREQNPGSETVAALLDSVESLRRGASGVSPGR